MKMEEFIINVLDDSNYEVAGKEAQGDIFAKLLPTDYKMAYKVSIENMEKSYKKVVVIDITNVFYSTYRIDGELYFGDVLGQILPKSDKKYKVKIEVVEEIENNKDFECIDIEYLKEILIQSGYLYENDDGDWFLHKGII
jgi:hypothetical protein